MKNCRLNSKRLKKYLQSRYNMRIANKLMCMFDFATGNLDYTTFYKQLDDCLMFSGISQLPN